MSELKDYSAIAGWTSLIFWLLYAFPQVYENWHLKSGRGLSLRYMALWLLGDSLNLCGCILTSQLETQTWLAFWFVLFDLILLGQVIYYDHVKLKFSGEAVYKSIVEGQVDEDGQVIEYGDNEPISNIHIISNAVVNNSIDDLSASQGGSDPSYFVSLSNDDYEDSERRSTCSSILSGDSPLYQSPMSSYIFDDQPTSSHNHNITNNGPRSLFAFYNERTNELEQEEISKTQSGQQQLHQQEQHQQQQLHSQPLHQEEPLVQEPQPTYQQQPSFYQQQQQRQQQQQQQSTSPSQPKPQTNKQLKVFLLLFSVLGVVTIHQGSDFLISSSTSSALSSHGGIHDVQYRQRVLLQNIQLENTAPECKDIECILGKLFGWASALLYIFSRFPQLFRNCTLQRCQPLVEAAVFVLWAGILGNVMYGLSILLFAGWDLNFLSVALPWLVGSLGSVPCDMVLFIQHSMWRDNRLNI